MECGPSLQWNIIQSSKEGCLTAAAAWMDLEDMTLTEISQSQQGKYWMIPLTSATENSQTPDEGVGWRLPGLQGGENGKLLFNGFRVSVWGDGRVLEVDGGDGCTTA